MCARRLVIVAALCLAALSVCSPARAIDPSGVLVLYNNASQEGIDIANYYAQVHPGVQLLGLDDLSPTATTISASDYLTKIRQPILNSGLLTPSIDVIVPTRGLPIRVHVEASDPGAYPNPHGGGNLFVLNWQTESSLESELAKIDYIVNESMMGDQSYQIGNHSTNTYYLSTEPFSHANFSTGPHSMRLTSRLDGFSVADVTAAIDRAQNAFVGPNNSPNGPFHFIVDNDPTAENYADQTMTALANNLAAKDLPHVHDDTTAFVDSAGGPLLGYTSHGAHQDSSPDDYLYAITDTLADGAVFNSWESFNAQSFTLGGNAGNQALVAEWLNRGGTAGVGNVAEPTAQFQTVINEDQMFAMLLDGMTFAEAAWSGARQLSWVNTVVGDPLMVWKQLLPGDANMDGVVDVGDINAMSAGWGKTVSPGGYGWTKGDLNGDGFIDFGDLALIDASWGQVSYWADVPLAMDGPFLSPMALALYSTMTPNPEPSTVVLLAVGLAALVGFGWRKRRACRAHQSAN